MMFMTFDSGPGVAGSLAFSKDFHNSFESHPSRKPFPSANYPTVSTCRHPRLILFQSFSGHFRAA
jgi:hypothetical protein